MEITDFWPLTLLLMCSLAMGQIPEPIDARQSLETSHSAERSEEEVEDKDHRSVSAPSSTPSSAPSSATPGDLVRSTPSTASKKDPEHLSDVLDDNFHMFRRRRSAEEEEDFGQESYVGPVSNYQQMFLDSQEMQGIREKLKRIKTIKNSKKAHVESKKRFSFFGIVERIYFKHQRGDQDQLQTITYNEK